MRNLSGLDFRLSESCLLDTGGSADLRLVPLHTQALQVRRTAARPLPPSAVSGLGAW